MVAINKKIYPNLSTMGLRTCSFCLILMIVCGLDKANSTEIDPTTAHPVVDLMPDQRGVTDKGATMRLGAYPCKLKPGTHPSLA